MKLEEFQNYITTESFFLPELFCVDVFEGFSSLIEFLINDFNLDHDPLHSELDFFDIKLQSMLSLSSADVILRLDENICFLSRLDLLCHATIGFSFGTLNFFVMLLTLFFKSSSSSLSNKALLWPIRGIDGTLDDRTCRFVFIINFFLVGTFSTTRL